MISLHEPEFDEQDEKRVLETLRSTWVSTGGPAVAEFEINFASFVGAPYAISVSSGTVAIQLMIHCLKKKLNIEGSFEVLIPSLTFIATANAIVHAGGVPHFVDVSPNSLNASAANFIQTFEQKYRKDANFGWVSKETNLPLLAIMPVNIMGWLADPAGISKFCKEIGVAFLEDAAESLGSYSIEKSHSGTQSLMSAYSFNGNKILTTGGGGMVVTSDPQFAHSLKHLSTTAKTDGLRFVHDEVGFNFRMVNILAALGCSQLQKMPQKLLQKKKIFEHYKLLINSKNSQIYEQADCVPNYWLNNVVFATFQKREKALMRLNENGFQARPIWTPIHLQPAYSKTGIQLNDFKNTEDMWNRTLSVPSSPQLLDSQIEQICNCIFDALKD